MTAQDFTIAINDHHLSSAWGEALEHWEDASATERGRVEAWIHGVRNQFVDYIADVQDDEEVKVAVSLKYLELRSQWMLLNTQSNYNLMRKGESPAELQYKCVVLSELIETLGKNLPVDERNKLDAALNSAQLGLH